MPSLDAAAWSDCSLAPGVVAPFDVDAAHRLVAAAIVDGAIVSAALAGTLVVGLAVAGPVTDDGHRELLALGVAPPYRRSGLAGALLAASPADYAEVTVAERDPVEPLDRTARASIARTLLERAGFSVSDADGALRAADPFALRAAR